MSPAERRELVRAWHAQLRRQADRRPGLHDRELGALRLVLRDANWPGSGWDGWSWKIEAFDRWTLEELGETPERMAATLEQERRT